MLFRAVLHQEALAQELWLGLLFTEILWTAGNRFYQYDMEQAKAGLLKGYALSEINKYSLNN
jgi:hypothetical protein